MIRSQLSFCKPHKFSVIDRLFIPSSFAPIHPQKRMQIMKNFHFTNKTNRNPKPKITSDFHSIFQHNAEMMMMKKLILNKKKIVFVGFPAGLQEDKRVALSL